MASILDKSGRFITKFVCSECKKELDNESIEKCPNCKAVFVEKKEARIKEENNKIAKFAKRQNRWKQLPTWQKALSIVGAILIIYIFGIIGLIIIFSLYFGLEYGFEKKENKE